MGVNLECAFTPSIKAVFAKGLGQTQNAHACSVSLFGVFALAHDDFNKRLHVRPNPSCVPTDAFGCPILFKAVMRWHMITMRRVLAIARGSGVCRDPFPFKIDLYCACSNPCP